MNQATEYINLIFTMVFVVEAIIKIIGLRWHYFRRAWNVFDFVVVALSVVGKFLLFPGYFRSYVVEYIQRSNDLYPAAGRLLTPLYYFPPPVAHIDLVL